MLSAPHFPYSGHYHVEHLCDVCALEAHLAALSYPGRREPVLTDIHLSIGAGQRVALVGPNGVGKSTLLKAIAGLIPTPPGAVKLFGQALGACLHRVAYLPQRGDIDWRFPVSVHQLVLAGRYVHLGWFKRPGAADRAIAEAMLDKVGLSALAHRQIGELSGGQQQRALLARALTQQADLLLLDEPLNAVDADTRQVITHTLADLAGQGKTILAATHDLARLEHDFDQVLELRDQTVHPLERV